MHTHNRSFPASLEKGSCFCGVLSWQLSTKRRGYGTCSRGCSERTLTMHIKKGSSPVLLAYSQCMLTIEVLRSLFKKGPYFYEALLNPLKSAFRSTRRSVWILFFGRVIRAQQISGIFCWDTHVHAHTHIHIHTHTDSHVVAYAYAYKYTHTHTHTHAHTHTHTQANTDTPTYTILKC